MPLHEAIPGARLSAPIPIDAARRFVRQKEPDGNIGVVKPIIPNLPPKPPRFSSVVARGFDGTQVHVEATIVPGQAVPEILPYFIGDKVVLLRDDGLEGDAVKRDGKFHGLLPVSLLDIERARGGDGGHARGIAAAGLQRPGAQASGTAGGCGGWAVR